MTEQSDRIAVVTGASGGIGEALAVLLAQAGHRVAIAARRESELARVAARCDGRALAVVTDVRRRDDVNRLRDRVIEAFGRVDIWVNNAGRGINKPVLELTDQDLDEMIAVNLKSALYGMQAALPHFMSRGEGHLINVSSFLGRVPMATFRSAYNAAKAALNSLTANARMDLAVTHPGIHVSVVMPGIVFTDFQRNAMGGTPPLPPGGTTGSKPQTADDVAQAVMTLIAKPVPEIYTNPVSAGMVRRYYDDVAAFEAGLLRH